MCEIVLVVVDTTHSDPYLDCACYKAGDIIDVLPDGWQWGKEDLSNPNWRIIKFPGVPVDQFTQFLSEQLPIDPVNPSKTLLRRAIRFAYAELANTNWATKHPAALTAFRNYITDATRKSQTLTVPANIVQELVQELDKISITKPLVADPAVIGTPQGSVIG